jgi:hypothetical protein
VLPINKAADVAVMLASNNVSDGATSFEERVMMVYESYEDIRPNEEVWKCLEVYANPTPIRRLTSDWHIQ